MYDDNAWNDLLYLFNSEALSQAWSQFRNFLGWRTPRWGMDGYRNFLPPASTYDIDKVRKELYEEPGEGQAAIEQTAPARIAAERTGWTFPDLELLRAMLAAPPRETVRMLLFPPYHHTHLPAPASRKEAALDECKTRIREMAGSLPNVHVLDFMFRSRITLADENYWDRVHYALPVAELIGATLVAGLTSREESGDTYRILWPTEADPQPVGRPHQQATHQSAR